MPNVIKSKSFHKQGVVLSEQMGGIPQSGAKKIPPIGVFLLIKTSLFPLLLSVGLI